jgi:hypothetical protein
MGRRSANYVLEDFHHVPATINGENLRARFRHVPATIKGPGVA